MHENGLRGRLCGVLVYLVAPSVVTAACPEPNPKVLLASTALALNQLAEAELSLDGFRDAVACAPLLSSRQAAWYFQLQGVLLSRQAGAPELEDTERTELEAESIAAFSAARRIAPEDWNPDLGQGSDFKAFQQAPRLVGAPVTVSLQNIGEREWVAFDGALAQAPFQVEPGLHLVQVGPAEGPARFGREFEAPLAKAVEITLPSTSKVRSDWRDATITVTSPLTPEQLAEWKRVRPALHLGIAFAGAQGESLERISVEGVRIAEPRSKLSMPLSIGLGGRVRDAWARLRFTLSPLANGDYMWTTGSTVATVAWHSQSFSLGGAVAGGAVWHRGYVGLEAGYTWPGRLPLRFIGGVPIAGEAWSVEMALGFNAATQRPAEPAASLGVVFAPSL